MEAALHRRAAFSPVGVAIAPTAATRQRSHGKRRKSERVRAAIGLLRRRGCRRIRRIERFFCECVGSGS